MFTYHRSTVGLIALAIGCGGSDRPTKREFESTRPALKNCNKALATNHVDWRTSCGDIWARPACSQAWKKKDATRESIINTCADIYCPDLSEHNLMLCTSPYDDAVWEPAFYSFSQIVLARDLRLADTNPATGSLGVNLIKHLNNQTEIATTIRLRPGEFSVDGGAWQDSRKHDMTPTICENETVKVKIFAEPTVPDFETGYYIATLRACGKKIELETNK